MSPLSNIAEDHELYPVLKQVYDDLDRVEDAIANIKVLHEVGRVSLEVETTQGKVLIPIGLEEFACIFVHDNTANTTFTGAGTDSTANSKITVYDKLGPQSGEIKGDVSNSHILIQKKGMYNIRATAAIESVAGGAVIVGFHAKVNGTATSAATRNIHIERRLSGGGTDRGAIAMAGIAELKKDDKLELWCWNATNGNSILISDVTLSAILLKET